MSFLLAAILIFIGFQFVFKFLIPVIIATRKVKKGFREMKDRMEGNMRQPQNFNPPPPQQKQGPAKSDYIEFEEIK